MCRFKSAIILEDEIFMPDYNSHEDMLEKLGIEDTDEIAGTKFIRAELYPKDGNRLSDPHDWYFNVDQDTTPSWFVSEYDEERMHKAFDEWYKTRNGRYIGNYCELSTLNQGDTFLVGNIEYMVLDKEGDKVSCLAVDLIHSNKVFDLETNNFAKSKLYTYLNEDYYKTLANIVGANNIIEHEVDLASNEGNVGFDKCIANVSLLTLEQYKKYRDIIPNADTWWWLATPYSYNRRISSHGVCYVGPGRRYSYDDCCCRDYGVRPFCLFKSSLSVSC